jgi:hypothetical protein
MIARGRLSGGALGTVCLLAAPGCRPAQPGGPSPAPQLAPAPWSEPALAAASVPAVYRAVWQAAENRQQCALLAPARLDPALASRATVRAATFGGGWGVAYDLPGERSAFGVAGTGASAWQGDIFDAWPERRVLADSSRVGYGPEGGGAGPNWLAYVRIPGQQCLYNVWSHRGQAHLEELLGQLRFVTIE